MTTSGGVDDGGGSDTVRAALVRRLREAGCVFAEEEANAVLAAGADPTLLERVVDGRRAGTPLEHLLGRARLDGHDLAVGPGLFVPRQRTSVLATRATQEARSRRRAVVVELCCGVAPVAAAVLRAVPTAEVVAADLDPGCLPFAASNAPGATVLVGDLWSALPGTLAGRVDVAAAVPPYVPTDDIALMPAEAREHEPRRALDGGTDGLDVARRLVGGAARWLAGDGVLLLEVHARQVGPLRAAARDAGLRARRVDERARTTSVVTLARAT